MSEQKEAFATVEDVVLLWRALTNDETARATALLPVVSDCLRQAALQRGQDLDKMIADGRLLSSVAKAVTVDVLSRVLR